jgi:ABC-2 type transport system ATP-binding protein
VVPPSVDSVAISVDGLGKAYRSRAGVVDAVRSVSFEVTHGEVFALLGPNGAGKTTVLQILEGFLARDSGAVAVLGCDPGSSAELTRLRQRVGIVFQETAVEPYLTVREVLQRNAAYYSDPRAVDEVIDLVGLAEKATARVKTLSGGQQRRLDVALGVVGRPDVLFLDEPTTGFDPSARRGAWELVHGLTRLGTTIVLTTHYMDEAQALADRVAVLVDGSIVAQGPPDSLAGRDRAATRIRFRLPAGVRQADIPLPVGPAADAPEDLWGKLVELDTDDPVRVLHELTGWALHSGHDLDALTVDRPSLEDVYLRLTGSGSDGAAVGSGPTADAAAPAAAKVGS